MAELSAETEAIIERLKAEGSLLRNSGTNSIKAINIKLDKFEGIFNTISNNIAAQTEAVRAGISSREAIAEAQSESAARQAAFEELNNQESDELRRLREQVETEKLKNELASEKEKAKGNSKGLFERFMGMGMGGRLLTVAGGAALLTVAYGYADEKTEGGLSRMVKAIRDTAWQKMSTAFNMLGEKMPLILTQLEEITNPEWVRATATAAVGTYAGLKAVEAGGQVLGAVGDAVSTAAIIEALRRRDGGAGPDGRGRDTPNARSRLKLRLGSPATMAASALIGTAMTTMLPAFSDIVRGTIGGMSKEELENRPIDMYDAAGNVVSGATLGMMFGPTGALVGAIVGLVVSAGQKLKEYIDDEVKDQGRITNIMEDALEASTEADDAYQAALKKRAELEKSLSETQLELMGLGNAQLERMKKEAEAELAERKRLALEAAVQSTETIQAQIDEELAKRAPVRRQFARRNTQTGEIELVDYGTDEAFQARVDRFNREREETITRLTKQLQDTQAAALEAGVNQADLYNALNPENLGLRGGPLRPENLEPSPSEMRRLDVTGMKMDQLIEAITNNAMSGSGSVVVRQGDTIAPVQNTIIEGSRSSTAANYVEMNAGGGSGGEAFGN